jgi:hypothetical protein
VHYLFFKTDTVLYVSIFIFLSQEAITGKVPAY